LLLVFVGGGEVVKGYDSLMRRKLISPTFNRVGLIGGARIALEGLTLNVDS
jgi:hypothetical protein